MRVVRPVQGLRGARGPVPGAGGGRYERGRTLRTIKAKAELLDPSRYGRSDRSPLGRWFWEIDRVLLLLVAVLIGIGLIAVAAASPAAGQRYSGGIGALRRAALFLPPIGVDRRLGVPVMIGISMLPRERAAALVDRRRGVLLRAAGLRADARAEEKNGAMRWINIGVGQLQPSEFLKPFFVVAMAWLLSLQAGRQVPAGLRACRRC